MQDIKEAPEEKVYTLLHDLRDTLLAFDRALLANDLRATQRISRQVRKYRKVVKSHHILAIYEALELPHNADLLKSFASFDPLFSEKFDEKRSLLAKLQKSIELEAFVKILLVQLLWREKVYHECDTLVSTTLERLESTNRRSLDHFTAQLYYFCSRIGEKCHHSAEVTPRLVEALNRAIVRTDQVGQSTLMNLLLRRYFQERQIEAAFNLIEKTSFPEAHSSHEFCKYLFYTGRVKAVRREYADALSRLNQAIRKAPDCARGFKLQCQKAAIVVELLQGDVPDREVFSECPALHPYYLLVQAVLKGELESFRRTVEQNAHVYQHDQLYTMVLRLNHIVLRIGLRKISLAYSRIALVDIATKLAIPAEETEFVVAKALRDGVMRGHIDHVLGQLVVAADDNFYVTSAPQEALHKRITYCLKMYHDTQKAITYPEVKGLLNPSMLEDDVPDEEILGLLEMEDGM